MAAAFSGFFIYKCLSSGAEARERDKYRDKDKYIKNYNNEFVSATKYMKYVDNKYKKLYQDYISLAKILNKPIIIKDNSKFIYDKYEFYNKVHIAYSHEITNESDYSKEQLYIIGKKFALDAYNDCNKIKSILEDLEKECDKLFLY